MEAVCIDKVGILAAQFLRSLIHHVGKIIKASCHVLRHGVGNLIGGGGEDPV